MYLVLDFCLKLSFENLQTLLFSNKSKRKTSFWRRINCPWEDLVCHIKIKMLIWWLHWQLEPYRKVKPKDLCMKFIWNTLLFSVGCEARCYLEITFSTYWELGVPMVSIIICNNLAKGWQENNILAACDIPLLLASAASSSTRTVHGPVAYLRNICCCTLFFLLLFVQDAMHLSLIV